MSSQLNNNQLANKQPFIEYENDKVGKIKVQQCLNKDPHLWFAILESQSQTETRGVDKPTYHTVVGSLTQQVADHVKDIIRHSPDNDKYGMVNLVLFGLNMARSRIICFIFPSTKPS